MRTLVCFAILALACGFVSAGECVVVNEMWKEGVERNSFTVKQADFGTITDANRSVKSQQMQIAMMTLDGVTFREEVPCEVIVEQRESWNINVYDEQPRVSPCDSKKACEDRVDKNCKMMGSERDTRRNVTFTQGSTCTGHCRNQVVNYVFCYD